MNDEYSRLIMYGKLIRFYYLIRFQPFLFRKIFLHRQFTAWWCVVSIGKRKSYFAFGNDFVHMFFSQFIKPLLNQIIFNISIWSNWVLWKITIICVICGNCPNIYDILPEPLRFGGAAAPPAPPSRTPMAEVL